MNTTTNDLFFNASVLPAKNHYVAWVDMMGTRNAMSHSLASSTNHIGRLHAAIIRSKNNNIRVYPMMDGAYIVCEEFGPIKNMLDGTFTLCANYFSSTDRPEHRFMIRASLSFGPVIDGADISAPCNAELAKTEFYKQSLLFGMPVIQAFKSDNFAPPFGIYLHESTRAFSGENSSPLSGVWLKWWRNEEFPSSFVERLYEHFAWCESNWLRIEYKLDRIKAHAEMAHQYFGTLDNSQNLTK